jgi:hypothetical protein
MNVDKKFYVSGVVDSGEECERVSNAEAQFFTVYERKPDGTSQAICDCDSQESAGLAAERMNELDEQLSTLASAAMYATNKNLWCERDDNIFEYRGKIWYVDVLEDALSKVKA